MEAKERLACSPLYKKNVPKLGINSAIDEQFWLDGRGVVPPLKRVNLPAAKNKTCTRESRAPVLTEDK